jgi:muramoyltetrapeptide carboxypeptidase LdcA involved in peptidoglycan recycling
MIEQLQNELSQATCDLINAVAFASEWQGQAVQLRDRIERALQVLRNAQTYDCQSGDVLGGMKACRHNAGDWVEAEVLSEVRKILEGTT